MRLTCGHGPAWFTILDWHAWSAKWLPEPDSALRFSITPLLIVVDVALFFLSPLSINVTGNLGQFDNLALLFGLATVFPRPRKNRLDIKPLIRG